MKRVGGRKMSELSELDFHGLSWTVMDCHGLSWTVMDCYGLLCTVLDYPRL